MSGRRARRYAGAYVSRDTLWIAVTADGRSYDLHSIAMDDLKLFEEIGTLAAQALDRMEADICWVARGRGELQATAFGPLIRAWQPPGRFTRHAVWIKKNGSTSWSVGPTIRRRLRAEGQDVPADAERALALAYEAHGYFRALGGDRA